MNEWEAQKTSHFPVCAVKLPVCISICGEGETNGFVVSYQNPPHLNAVPAMYNAL